MSANGGQVGAGGKARSGGEAGTGARPDARGFAAFLELERAARRADSVRALDWIVVNDTRRLVDYRQAVLLMPRGGRGWRVAAVAGVSSPDPDAPATRWFAASAARLAPRPAADRAPAADGASRLVTAADLSDPAAAESWGRWAAGHALLCPLVAPPDSRPQGLLMLFRDRPWSEPDRVLVERLAEAYGHARRA
ncbi:MAG: hypothetical protein RID91_23115, partial [Azospirillaceae bacterium]